MFWPSSKNKNNLENLIHRRAQCHSWNHCVTEVLVSGFDVSGGIGVLPYKLSGESVCEVPELYADIEEADLRTVLHAFHATKDGSKRLVVLSSDTDVFILFQYHWSELKLEGLEELWVKAGTRDSSRYVPIHDLAEQIGQGLCQVLPAVHTLTGCDYSSKFGTKFMALKASPEKYLMEFGAINNIDQQVSLAEEYLVKVSKKAPACTATDQLRYHLYHHSKRQCFEDLPSTSYVTQLHNTEGILCHI